MVIIEILFRMLMPFFILALCALLLIEPEQWAFAIEIRERLTNFTLTQP